MIAMTRPVLVSLIAFTILTGVLYPLAVTGLAQLLFPAQANGSLIMKEGKPIGSSLVGQPFDDPKYFWGRLSATAPFPYNAASSGGSNLAQTNPDLIKNVQGRIDALKAAGFQPSGPVPADLVTASGSGLDPHISLAAAEYQAARVAKTRGLDESNLHTLIAKHTESRQLGLFGEPRVNVLRLNMALDALVSQRESGKE
ncbi:MAG TPA: potassium-transporting ATPase subunit KdpC [Dissulfurispiraceae bacterium]|nr:potassium-transporting ATPase subunit KdpC [Dissulfurispiraceae bacterium]